MKIVCKKSDLVNGTQIVSRAVPSHTTMPILECILIEAANGFIKLTANNMDLGIETVIEGEIEEKGIIALDAKIFLNIVRKLPDNLVTIQTDENYQAFITCESANFNIPGKSGEDFSYLPDIERDNSIVISQFTLKEVIRQTIFSIIENDNNKMMGGENIVINKDMMTVDSLDGHRISRRMIELKGEFGSVNAIIPGRTLKEISNILSGDADKDVNIFFTDNNVLFEFDNTIVLSRLIEGPYFNVEHMITKDYKIKFKINKKHLLECLDRASLLVKEGEKKPIIMNINDNELKLSINSSIGNMEELIDIEKEGEDIRIGFNPKFLIDALHVIDDDEVNIYLIDSKAPCVIKNDENSYLYMILPINII